MKLLERYNRVNLLSTITVFILAGIAFYFALHFTLIRQMDEDLRIEQREIINYVKQNDSIPHPVNVKDQQITYEQTTKPLKGKRHKIIRVTGDDEDYRELSFSILAGGKWYNVSVSKSLEATKIISHAVFLITFFTIFLIFIATFVINSTILKRLWQPFYHSLDILQHFQVGDQQALQFPETHIDEFSFMNDTLKRSTGKALQDYNALKVFTENASHELQTPLAIIRSKLEVIMQGDNLYEHQFLALQSATEAINRLSRMNQSLLLLTKIENEQFALKTEVDIDQLLSKKIAQFKELWDDRSLTFQTDISPVTLHANRELVEVLLNNLFSNATRHNYEKGEIYISLNEQRLLVSNTGNNTPLSKTHLFQRFYNPSNNSTSNGLGLAVIRQICEASGLSVQYDYIENKHQFIVIF
jgi:signal transduction histidine kinase